VNNKYNFPTAAVAASVEALRLGRVAGEGGGMEGLKFKHQRIDSGGGGGGGSRGYIVPKEKRKLFLVVHKSEKLTLMPKQKRRTLIYNQLFAVTLTSSKHANVIFIFFLPVRHRARNVYI